MIPYSAMENDEPVQVFPLIPVRLPAWVLIAGWFLLQLISGIASLSPNAGSAVAGGVAYWAHVGGLITGAILIWIFRQPQDLAQVHAFPSQVDRRRAG
jgi:membrane associated rhomboid family serine protease